MAGDISDMTKDTIKPLKIQPDKSIITLLHVKTNSVKTAVRNVLLCSVAVQDERGVVLWCGVVWCGVVWCGVVWCGVVWCGVVWCGVVWCGVVMRHNVTRCVAVRCSAAHCVVLCCVVLYTCMFSTYVP